MSLVSLFVSDKDDNAAEKHIQQLVAIAGNGVLKDGNGTSQELREYFSAVSTVTLRRHLDECISTAFTDGGLVLQDLVNELGARLDCKVECGLYRGKLGAIGWDGIWNYPDGHALVVEVKTTDAYAINLDKIADYRKNLISTKKVKEESSILLVVGRQDTEGLEAQVRGSRHAWDIRIISADALLRLVEAKEDADSGVTIEKLRSVLKPRELTKVDFIVDLLASATEDIKTELEDVVEKEDSGAHKEKAFTPVAFNEDVSRKVARKLDISLRKKTRSLFESADGKTAVLCVVSKAHEAINRTYFWYAYHPHQSESLKGYKKAYVAFGCGDPGAVLLFDLKEFEAWRSHMNVTERETRMYWHVQFAKDTAGRYFTHFKASMKPVDVTSHLVTAN